MHNGSVYVPRQLHEDQEGGDRAAGCSVDTADAHRAFIKKYGLPFPLLLDPDKKISTEYGVANGIAKYGLDGRVTYVIGGDGEILKVYPKVDPALNTSEIISEFGTKRTAMAN